ncbi:MAG: hypothetical protein OXP66_08185 [Candidatus Tectomicrobia bacterium]|nr:hypothetical protein [Candidatus Tectomicrobia bacterium]
MTVPDTPTDADVAALVNALRLEDDTAREDDARLRQLLAAGAALANRQAPGAPVAVANEALIRFAGYLYEGPMEDYQPAAIWRRCGAAGLLSPWTIRRAAAIETAESD